MSTLIKIGSCSEKCPSCPSRHVLRRSEIVRSQSGSRSPGQPGSHPELFAALRSRDRVTSLHVLSCLYRTLASHLAHKSNHTTGASVYVFTVAMPTPIDVTPRFVHCYSITLYHVITRPYVGTGLATPTLSELPAITTGRRHWKERDNRRLRPMEHKSISKLIHGEV